MASGFNEKIGHKSTGGQSVQGCLGLQFTGEEKEADSLLT